MKPARASLRLRRVYGAGLAAALLGGGGFAGCYLDSEGLSPPLDSFYYPTAIVVSPGRTALYVINSDFDLQYNGGTVQVLNLPKVRAAALALRNELAASGDPKEACRVVPMDPGEAALEVIDGPDRVLYPGPCKAYALSHVLEGTAVTGAFASGAVLAHNTPGAARLFVAVRGDPSVTFFDVADDRGLDETACASDPGSCFFLRCGQDGAQRCSADYRVGESFPESTRKLTLPGEPVGIAVDSRSHALVLAHQTTNQASLITGLWGGTSGEPKPAKPGLKYVLPDLAAEPTELAALPEPRLSVDLADQSNWPVTLDPNTNKLVVTPATFSYHPGVVLTHRAAAEVDLLRYLDDSNAGEDRTFMTVASAAGITNVANGNDSRGVAVDASARQAAESACASERDACVAACAGMADDARRLCEDPCKETAGGCLAESADIPIALYIAHRSPSSLLVGEVRTELIPAENPGSDPRTKWAGAYDTISIRDTVPLALGPSRVAVGHVIGTDGKPHVRVFTVAFDSRYVFSYDPEARRLDPPINTGRGPHAIAFDTSPEGASGDQAYSFMYVAHFTDSYVGVVDLDMRKPSTFGSMILTLGTPVAPRESQ